MAPEGLAPLRPDLSFQSLGPNSAETLPSRFKSSGVPASVPDQWPEGKGQSHPPCPALWRAVGEAIGHSPKRSRDLGEVVVTRSVTPRQS